MVHGYEWFFDEIWEDLDLLDFDFDEEYEYETEDFDTELEGLEDLLGGWL